MIFIQTSLIFYNQESNTQALQHLSSEDFKQFIQTGQGTLVDVRTAPEYMQAHIDGSHLIDFYATGFTEKLLQMDPEQTILIYCRTGHRSRITGEFLIKNGFKSVINLKNGIVEWYSKGFPLEFDSL